MRRSVEDYEARGFLTRERLGYFLNTAAMRWPDRELICIEGQRYTYAEADRWATLIAQDLVRRGLGPGARILIQAENSMEMLMLVFAAWRIGLVTIPIIPVYRHHEVAQIVAEMRPQVIAVTRRSRGRDFCEELDEACRAAALEPQLRYVIDDSAAEPSAPGWVAVPTMASGGADQAVILPEPTPADECVLILYTSGTTSRPKGAMLTGGAILANARTWVTILGLYEKDVWYAAWPLAHVAALAMAVFMPMLVGGRTVIHRTWSVDRAIETFASEGVTSVSASPLFLHDVLERYRSGAGNGYRVRHWTSGSAPTPPAMVYAAQALGLSVTKAYGMTEIAGVATLMPRDAPLDLRAWSDGKVVPGTEVEIVDADRKPLPLGTAGEVRIRGPQNMLGYTDPAATAAQTDADGWFYTGDLGTLDAEGYLQISGRTKDIINRGGEKFPCQDIEDALAGHELIGRAVVVGKPDERFGEVVAAFVQLRAGATWPGPEPVLRYLEELKLAKQKFPVHWEVVEELPMTATGKVRKDELLRKLAHNS